MLRAALIVIILGAAATADGQIVRSPELRLQYHRAERAWRTGSSLLEARARLDRVIGELPEDGPAHLLRSKVHSALDEPELALRDARSAAQLMPESGEAALVHCEAARHLGEAAEAIEALQRAAELFTDDAEAHVRLAFNALQLGETSQAEAFARVAVALNDRLPAAYRQLAHVFVTTGRTEEAAMILARGLRSGVITPHMLDSDEQLAVLRNHPIVTAAL